MKRKILTKMISISLCLTLIASMVMGCGKKEDSSGSESSSSIEVTLNEVAHSIFYAPMYVAIEEGYFKEEGIELTLEADIGFMGSESTIYTYAGGTQDYVVNFAQLTQRAGNFLVARQPIDNFSWDMIKDSDVLGGRAGVVR